MLASQRDEMSGVCIGRGVRHIFIVAIVVATTLIDFDYFSRRWFGDSIDCCVSFQLVRNNGTALHQTETLTTAFVSYLLSGFKS